MGQQVNLLDVGAPSPVEKPARLSPPQFEARSEFEPFTKDVPVAGDKLTIVHVTGAVKQVRFLDVNETYAHVQWPISNDVIEVSLKTGDLRIRRGVVIWRLEPTALKACRHLRNTKSKKLRLVPEE
jgi:hypothetical protein